MEFDLIVEHGTVIDGTGAPGRPAAVGITGQQITAIGDLAGSASAARRLDARGLAVAPGFIDIHNHSDLALLLDGRAESMLRQGVTTQVTGNCGLSPAPVHDGVRADLKGTLSGLESELPWTWDSFAQYLDVLRAAPKATHVVPLVGHGSIRAAAMGFVNRPPTPAELAEMERLTAESMEAGAFGMSTGLVYPPGLYSATEELIALSRVARRYGGYYASHMRGEANPVVESVKEVLRIAEETGIPIQISHHKAAGRENWGKVRITYALIEAAARQQDVSFDIYPYTAGSANLSQLVPPWAHVGGPEAMQARLQEPAHRPRILHDMVHGIPDWNNFFRIDWRDIRLAYVHAERNRWMQGLSVHDAAERQGRDPVELAVDLIVADGNRTTMVNFVMAEEDVDFLLPKPESMIGSDGRSFTPGGPTGGGHPHPRSYGAFPRVFARYVREKRVLTLESAVHKMTGRPARKLGLARRGELKPGYNADLVLFDPAAIRDCATFEKPHQFAAGIHWVVVNGHPALDNGALSSRLTGEVLTPNR
ncbi:MAG TPA: D-aminoacylase [Candidatus Baltobacteraceae bacterium]|nr:D-aminoacylase [Candidatus Baltobacteraceae bacterium]